MKTYTVGTDTFAVFEKQKNNTLLMLHFIWGKKDFRLFCELAKEGSVSPLALEREGKFYNPIRFEYLYEYEWYVFDKVTGHGLAHDEVRFTQGSKIRYVELPKDLYDISLELISMELGLTRSSSIALTG